MMYSCAMLEIPVDPLALYRCRDQNALTIMDTLIRQVNAAHQAEKARSDNAASAAAARGGRR